MSRYRAAVSVEWTKFRRSPVSGATTALLVLGVAAISAASFASIGKDGVLGAKAELLAVGEGWVGLFGLASQVMAVGGILGFGVMAGWLYGREFTDGTVSALFARPVPLSALAAAKLTIYLVWAATVAALVLGSVLAVGAALALAGDASLEAAAVPGPALRLVVVTALTALLATPCALVATLARGYLAAVAAAITIVVVAQVAVMLGVGAWFPFAAPGVWAADVPGADGVSPAQLALAVPVSLAAAAATVHAWRRLTL